MFFNKFFKKLKYYFISNLLVYSNLITSFKTMSSFSNNNNTETNEFWFDKNEFYAENGLAKGHKKDRKSRSKKALEQADERQKKQDEHISHLPSKMQKILLKATPNKAVVVEKPKEKTSSGKIHKKFANPVKNISCDVAYDDEYGVEDEEDVVEEDTLIDEAY